jgi:hypothetical protein
VIVRSLREGQEDESVQGGVEHVPAGLQNVGDAGQALSGTIAHLHSVHQLAPLQSALYFVTNRVNHEEYAGVAGKHVHVSL